MAIVVKLTAVAPDEGYNLAVAALFGLAAAAVFTVAGTLWATARGDRGAVRAGLAGVGLVLVAGNLEGARLLIADGGPLRDYDWFAASRVIPDTITEFPWFSFLLGDLHAHVLAIPFTLLALAFVLQAALAGPRLAGRGRALLEGGAAALAIGFLYAVNSWSYPVLAGLLVLAVVAWLRDPRSEAARPAAVRWLLAVLAASALLMLPFHLTFDPAAHGIGVVGRGARLRALAARRAAAVRRARRVRRRGLRRRAGRHAAAGPQRGLDRGRGGVRRLAPGRASTTRTSRCWPCCSLVALAALLAERTPPPQRLVWLLAAGGVACVLGPELLYVRDEFDGSALYRMNTVFKLGYQAWLLLGLAGIGALAWWQAWLPRRGVRWAFAAAAAVALAGAAVYPVAGTYARKGGFSRAPTLDGLGWLRDRAPGDVGRDRVAERPRAGRLRRARGGRPGLLRLRPRAHLDVHRPAVRAGLGRARAPVGPRRRRPGGAGRAGVLLAHRRRGAGGARRATGCATSSSARWSARTTATPAWRSGTSSASACSTPTARRCGRSPRVP